MPVRGTARPRGAGGRLVPLALLAALALTGCGGNDDEAAAGQGLQAGG
jgi:hypothetical protein